MGKRQNALTLHFKGQHTVKMNKRTPPRVCTPARTPARKRTYEPAVLRDLFLK